MSTKKDTRKIAYSYIRFSTPDQIKGDSLRRQKEASEKYALENNLRLDSSLRMEDLGVSAYKGKNATHGALKGFMTAVVQKKVPVGSVLLVESLDRLSRANVLEAFEQFSTIIRAGVTIVTLLDKMTYSRETIEAHPLTLFGSIAVMMRANDEVKTKAKRISQAWEKKRLDALNDKKPLTSRCPAWLELVNGKYILIKKRADLVRRIFSLYIAGHGKRSIAKIFNEEGIDTWRCKNIKIKANGWHDSYIQKILNNEAVLGRYQPHAKSEKSSRRTPVGESIENYFPPVIDAKMWRSAHLRPAAARGHKGSDKKVSNLFSGIVFDGYNGARMRFVDKGGKRGQGKYLSSDIKRLKPSSKGQNWPYPDFEKMIIAWLEGLNWENLYSHSVDSDVSKHESERAVLSLKNEKLEKDLERLLDSFVDANESLRQRVNERIRKIDSDITINKQTIEKIDSEISQKSETRFAMLEGFKKFRNLTIDQSYSGRVNLQTEIRRRIKEIKLYRYGGLQYPGLGKAAQQESKKPCVQIIYKNDSEEQIRLEISKSLTEAMKEWTERFRKKSSKSKHSNRDSLWNEMENMDPEVQSENIHVSPELEPHKHLVVKAVKERNQRIREAAKDRKNVVFVDRNIFDGSGSFVPKLKSNAKVSKPIKKRIGIVNKSKQK